MAKHLKRKVSIYLVSLLVLLSISGCTRIGGDPIYFHVENSQHLISATDQIYIRYTDGSSSPAATFDSTTVNEDVYKATTSLGKTIAGAYVSDGNVSWVPEYGGSWYDFISYLTYNPLTWAKPTIPASYATVNNVVYSTSANDYIDVTLNIFGANARKVDGRADVFLQSADSSVKFTDASDEIGLSTFTGYNTGSVTFRMLASTLNISTLQLSFNSGPIENLPIRPVDVASLTVNSNSSSLIAGDTMQMSAIAAPAFVSNSNVVWSVETGTGSATINSTTGLLSGSTVGTVTVRATALDGSGISGTKTVTVLADPSFVPVTEIQVGSAGNLASVLSGQTIGMSAEVTPLNATNKVVAWSITNGSGTANIDSTSGVLTAVAPGTVTVKATSTDGSLIFGTKQMNVTPILINSITLNGSSSVTVGGTVQFTETVLPSTATDKSVAWSVVNGSGSATINQSGLLTSTSVGTVIIKAAATDSSNSLGTASLTIVAAPTPTPIRTSSSPTPVPTASPTPAPTISPIPTLAPTATPTPAIFNNDVVDNNREVNAIQLLVEKANNSADHVELADVKGHWAEKTVDTFIKLGVIQGYGNNKFNPDGNITRAEFATILTKVFSMDIGTKSVKLGDLDKHWAKAAIEKLASLGVLSGYGDGTFKPDRTISREEMIIIISRIVNLTPAAQGSNNEAFTDIDNSYAKAALNDAVNAGIISGKGDNKIEPKSKATRAEALTVMLNTLNLNPQLKALLAELN